MDKHDRVSIIYFSFLLIPTFLIIILLVSTKTKRGCVVRMVVDSIPPHAKIGPNDHWKDAPPFNSCIGHGSLPLVGFSGTGPTRDVGVLLMVCQQHS